MKIDESWIQLLFSLFGRDNTMVRNGHCVAYLKSDPPVPGTCVYGIGKLSAENSSHWDDWLRAWASLTLGLVNCHLVSHILSCCHPGQFPWSLQVLAGTEPEDSPSWSFVQLECPPVNALLWYEKTWGKKSMGTFRPLLETPIARRNLSYRIKPTHFFPS